MQTISSSSDRPGGATQGFDSPGVRLPPPLLYIAAFLIGLALQARFPLPFLAQPVALGLGAALAAVGALCIVTSIPAMLRGHGTLNTAGPSVALVVSGPYRYSRNPMYLGLVLLFTGAAVMLADTWALLFVLPLVLYTQTRVILPEERYLQRAFGDTYRAYCSHVRRWL
ncbi:MAG TPA: isoprenylcysteine carboxylmethyltransferase family protein [Ktedonobacterales bacterium]|nr:isoprenylcysteine carboxylmethyltransferase family protein [Ktedonobacterales bacterium]